MKAMNLLESFRRLFSRKESETRALMVVNTVGRAVGTPRRYDKFAEEGYQKNVIVYACANLIANACAQIPWLLYQKPSSRRGRKVEIESHPFFDLTDRPNPYMSSTEFRVGTVLFRLLAGNAYWQAVGPTPNQINELHLWRPDRTKVVPGANGYPQAYEYEVGGRKLTVPVDFVSGKSPILHLKRFHPLNDFYGLAGIEPAILGIDQHNEAGRWNLSLLQNGARPDSVIKAAASNLNPSASMTPDQRAALKEEILKAYQGARNAGRPMVLEGNMEYEQISLSPKDMDWISAKDTSARDIARAFGVPPMLLGIPGDNTYSNYEQANFAFYEQTVLPELKYLSSWLQLWLIPTLDPKRAGQILVEFDTDAVDALAPKRKMVWEQMEKASWLTPDEKRERTGFSPLPEGGDQLLVPAGMVPLSFALDPGMPAEPNPAAQEPNPAAQDPNAVDPGLDVPAEPPQDPNAQDPAGTAGGAKSFNLKSDRAKYREWREVNRIRMRFEKRLKSQLGVLFKVQGQEVAAAVSNSSAQELEAAAFAAIDANRRKFHVLIEAMLLQVGNEFGSRTINALKHSRGAPETKDTPIRFQAHFRDWAHQHAGDKIEEITQTTKKQVKRAIEDWQEQGDPISKLSDNLETLHEDFAGPRAETIAITETHTASTRASLQGAKDTGIPNLRKEWIFTHDSKTRPEHRLPANETIVGIDEKFNVAGEQLDAPGDPAGSPGNIIRCRCAVAFLTEGE
jgi:HK97 family phage portal protein